MFQVIPSFHKINTQDTRFRLMSHNNSQQIINNKIQMETEIPTLLLIHTLLKLLSMERYTLFMILLLLIMFEKLK